MTIQEQRDKIWKEFLDKWPVARLEKMKLEEYTNLNRSDSFCYWLEKHTEILGSIWGGSAYKFGIYKKNNTDSNDTRKGYKNDGEYGWVLKFGITREEAFETVRQNVYNVAKSASEGKLGDINDIELGQVFKWKIAALYNKNIPLIYKPEALEKICLEKGIDWPKSYSKVYEELAKLGKGKDIIEHSIELWAIYSSGSKPKELETEYLRKWSSPLNQIFYGPPGTGKTYNTINEAVQIVEELSPDEFRDKYEDNRSALKEAYQKYVDEKLIGFCTFHQSFSYEDFIEGIKPIEPKENDTYLKYDVVPGIFKQMANKATTYEKYKVKETAKALTLDDSAYSQAQFYKMSLGDTLSPEDDNIYKYCIKNNVIALGWGGDVDFTGAKSEEDIRIICDKNNLDSSALKFVKYFILYLKLGNYVIISNGNTSIRAIGKVIGEYEFNDDTDIDYCQFREVEWILKDTNIPVNELYNRNFSQQTIYKLDKDLIKREFFESKSDVILDTKERELLRNHVLIIDEINRGNISQIFGELITLIEDDKREGKPEALKTILPYSKQPFSVPSNLYIIGTMNTADRSIEALDTALRRRFTFREMPPKNDILRNHHERIIYNQIVKNVSLLWEDKEWKEIEADLKELFIDSAKYEENKIELREKLIGNEGAIKEFDAEEHENFYKAKEIELIDFEKLINCINFRIEKLLDKDHAIGHAYFLSLLNCSYPFNELNLIFENKIIPLLQEYFYGDFGKIGLVLGDSFVETKQYSEKNLFANFKGYDADVKSDLQQRPVYVIKPSENWKVADFISIYKSYNE